MIVFDSTLLVKKALAALLQHNVQSAPVWDSKKQVYVGMLTVTDFIQLILYYYEQSTLEEALQQVESLTIQNLRDLERDVLNSLPSSSLIVSPSDTLYHASKLLIESQLHRLPILEAGVCSDTIISVLTQSKILRYISTTESSQTIMNVTLKEMKVGTFDNLITAKYDNLLIDILNIFIKQKISSVPVVDEEGNVVNVYEKYDALLLAKDVPLYNLQMTIKEALSYRSMDFAGIHTCQMQDTFGQLMETIRNNTVRRFVILDGKKLKGMLSLTDILKYVVELK